MLPDQPWKYRSTAAVLCAGCVLSAMLASAPSVHAGGRTDELKAQGAALFADKGCAHCHGQSGFGGSDSGPDLSRVRKELKAPEIAQQIRDGGNNMPPFGESLSADEIRALVEYLRSKRKPPPGFRAHPLNVPASTPVAKPDPD
jgi:mono/diheme cytochrome c family protein